jgi:threonine dehydrogenase-like Zn-dependent dehydrogenase
MKALKFDGTLKLVDDAHLPSHRQEALVQVLCAGICNTDLEITRGYAGFNGTLGHEFVGRVVSSPESGLVGKRVVGEINAGCGSCRRCLAGDPRHCPGRTVLGIHGRDGAFAEFVQLPTKNLIEVPDVLSDEAAVFAEPLAAACRILEQVSISAEMAVAVVGDGKLGQLVARLIAQTNCRLAMIGRHRRKLELAASSCGAYCVNIDAGLDQARRKVLEWNRGEPLDLIVEASGSRTGLDAALTLVRPEGTVVLKTTHHDSLSLRTGQVVVNEIRLMGSRCGRLAPALDLLAVGAIDVVDLISEQLPLDEGLKAFKQAAIPGTLKVLLQVS